MFRGSTHTPDSPPPPSGSWRGIVLIVGIFVFAGALLLILFKAPRMTDTAPSTARWGAPAEPIRVMNVHLAGDDPAVDSIAKLAATFKADVVCVQGIRIEQVETLGKALGMSRAGGDVYYPAQNHGGASAPFGNAIYSRFPLYESRSVPSKAGSFGVWATAVAGDVKFVIASTDFSDDADTRAAEARILVRAWRELDSPPMIVCSSARLQSDELSEIAAGRGIVATRNWEAGETPSPAGATFVVLTRRSVP